MITNFLKVFTLAGIIFLASALPADSKKTVPVPSIYLTWDNEDTATTMVVKVLTLEKPRNPRLILGTAVQMLRGESRELFPSDERDIKTTPIYVTSFSLKNLTPDTTYFFNYKDDTHLFAGEKSFRTLPDNDTPIEFIQGGDLSATGTVETVVQHAVTKDTMAYVIGGDIAYENGALSNYKMYLSWFKVMNRAIIAPDGRLVPLILAIGNHEVNTTSSSSPSLDRSPFYMNLFLQSNGRSYFKRKLGTHTDLLALDTDHISPHNGTQRDWIENELENSNAANKFAVYHVPLYPTYRDYEGSGSLNGRKYWLPLFDKYALTVGFENHDHTLKRTHMLKENKKVAANGTVYVGDGCWGVGTRPANKRWYHHIAESKNHVWRVLATPTSVHLQAIGKNGETLDEFTIENRKIVKRTTTREKVASR